MNKSLIAGALAFVAAFGAERLLETLAKDVGRYDRMREMSGQPPMLKELLATAGGFIGAATRQNGFSALIGDLTQDAVRYAKMKSM